MKIIVSVLLSETCSYSVLSFTCKMKVKIKIEFIAYLIISNFPDLLLL